MGLVTDSRIRVARLEARVVEDRRAVVFAARRLMARSMQQLGRPDVLLWCYAAGTLLGASGADVLSRLADVARRLGALPDPGAGGANTRAE